jgi:hypothetical protein
MKAKLVAFWKGMKRWKRWSVVSLAVFAMAMAAVFLATTQKVEIRQYPKQGFVGLYWTGRTDAHGTTEHRCFYRWGSGPIRMARLTVTEGTKAK